MSTTETLSTKATAAALRKALRIMFPKAKFSVTMARGTAYGWLDVNWTDGPTTDEVDQVCARFESSRFDGYDDSYHRTGNDEYSCCGINTHRMISDEIIARGVALIQRNEYGERFIDADGAHALELFPSDHDHRIVREWANQIAFS